MAIGSVAQNKVNAEVILRLENLQTQLTGISDKVARTNAKMAGSAQKAAKSTSAAWAAGFAIISVVALKMARKVTAAFGNMVDVYATFEQSLANTQSVARASAEELDKMEEAARRVGATTRSTASEAANALYYLASAGFSASEAIAALDGVNALAIATQSDLASTSETVAVTIRQYGLETSAATDIANTFTAAITNSLATMNKLAKSFEYVGPIAAGLGLTVEETTGALQLLYNKGFSGEKAGRGLRSILVDLADATSVVNKKLGKMGIAFNEVNPATNKLADIMDTLREKGVKAANAAAIFGKVSGVQLASLISIASDAEGGMNELIAAVTGTQRAFEAMDIQMDTLKGSMDKFRNAEEALEISIGKQLSPTLRSLVDTGTSILLLVNKLPEPLLAAASIFVTITALVTTLTVALVGLKLALSSALIAPVITALGSLAFPLIAVASLAAAATAGLAALNSIKLSDSIEEFGEMAKEMGATEEQLAKVSVALKHVNEDFRQISKSGSLSADQLKSTIASLVDKYGLTEKQVLKVAMANEELMAVSKDLIIEMWNQVEAEEAIAKAEEDRWAKVYAMTEAEKRARSSATKYFQERKEQIKLEEEQGDILGGLEIAFIRARENQKLLGDEFNRSSYLTNIYNNSLKKLVDQGLMAESDAIILLQQKWIEYQSAYGEVVFPTGDEIKELPNVTQEYIDKLIALNEAQEEVGKTALEVLSIQEERALANVELTEDEIEAIKNYFTMAKKLQKIRNEDDAIERTKEYKQQLEELTMTELELIEAEHERAIESVLASDLGAIAMSDLIKAINELYDALEDEAAFDAFVDNFETVVDAIGDFTSAIDDFIQVSIQNQIDAEERLLQTRLDAIDEAERAALESAGVQEKTALELAQEKIDKAIMAGDLIAQQEAQNDFDRLVIQQEFDAQRLALEEEAARKIADLQYKADMVAWAANSITAVTQSALAILSAYAQTPVPFKAAAASIAGALAGIQLATIAASRPQRPTFADGGVVPGSSYKGDVTPILANAGEVILNKAQQENVAGQFGNDKPIQITVNSILDGKVVATNSAKYYRNGQVKL